MCCVLFLNFSVPFVSLPNDVACGCYKRLAIGFVNLHLPRALKSVASGSTGLKVSVRQSSLIAFSETTLCSI